MAQGQGLNVDASLSGSSSASSAGGAVRFGNITQGGSTNWTTIAVVAAFALVAILFLRRRKGK